MQCFNCFFFVTKYELFKELIEYLLSFLLICYSLRFSDQVVSFVLNFLLQSNHIKLFCYLQRLCILLLVFLSISFFPQHFTLDIYHKTILFYFFSKYFQFFSLVPTFFDAKLLLADTLHQMGRSHDALKIYITLIQEDKDHFEVNHNYAAILQEQGKQINYFTRINFIQPLLWINRDSSQWPLSHKRNATTELSVFLTFVIIIIHVITVSLRISYIKCFAKMD